MTGGDATAALTGCVPPPKNPRTTNATTMAAHAANAMMMIRDLFMEIGSFVPIRPRNPLEID
jgi:hypothetical protein